MVIRNEDVASVTVEIPPGHSHLRTTVVLSDGTELTFQEATVSNLIRAFLAVKTHPVEKKITLEGRALEETKPGFARWQLLEAPKKREEGR